VSRRRAVELADDPAAPPHCMMKLSNADAVGGGSSSCVLEQQQQLYGMSRRICKLLQWGKERYKLVLVVIKQRNKKKSVHVENLDVAKLTRSCARRRQPPMTRIGSIHMKNRVHGFLTKLRDAYVNMMNSVASSGYLDGAAGMVLVDTWQFPMHTSSYHMSNNSMLQYYDHDAEYAADLKLVALDERSSNYVYQGICTSSSLLHTTILE
jgi:hypothetical protein